MEQYLIDGILYQKTDQCPICSYAYTIQDIPGFVRKQQKQFFHCIQCGIQLKIHICSEYNDLICIYAENIPLKAVKQNPFFRPNILGEVLSPPNLNPFLETNVFLQPDTHQPTPEELIQITIYKMRTFREQWIKMLVIYDQFTEDLVEFLMQQTKK